MPMALLPVNVPIIVVPGVQRVKHGFAHARRKSMQNPLPMTAKILVINPNSTEAVTRGIDEACAPLRMPGGPAIDCVTLKEGPPGIETQQHVDSVVPHLLSLVSQKDTQYAAFVIACYSDPEIGRASCRERVE